MASHDDLDPPTGLPPGERERKVERGERGEAALGVVLKRLDHLSRFLFDKRPCPVPDERKYGVVLCTSVGLHECGWQFFSER